MENILNKKTSKILIVLIILAIIFNYIVPNFCYADPVGTVPTNTTNSSSGNTTNSTNNQSATSYTVGNKKQDTSFDWGGDLIQHIGNLFCSFGDILLDLMQDKMLPGSPKAVGKRLMTVLTTDEAIQDADEQERSDEQAKGTGHIVGGAAVGGTLIGLWTAGAAGLTVLTGGAALIAIGAIAGGILLWRASQSKLSQVPIPEIYYGPMAILSNKIPALDINFIDESSETKNVFLSDENTANPDLFVSTNVDDLSSTNGIGLTYILQAADLGDNANKQDLEAIVKKIDDEKLVNGNTANVLRPIVAKWYVALRNISVIGLLIVLVYIGIRILISSAADEKAKYKTYLKDWVLALVLVFAIHYLMLFLINITNIIINMLSSNYKILSGDDFMNLVRIYVISSTNIFDEVGYVIMFDVLVFYTAMFTWKYIKRVVYMAFLTIIAPLVALTYPIDKISDSRSQAFDAWFKEYLFNLLLQPIDLLLYIIFVSSAIDLSTSNMLYALVAIGFIMQAEGFVKKMFGIEAQHGAGSGGFAAGAIFGGAVNALQRGSGGLSNIFGGGSSDETNSSSDDIHMADNREADEKRTIAENMFGGNAGSDFAPIEGEGTNGLPLGGGTNPLGGGANPLGGGTNPLGGGTNPLGGGNTRDSLDGGQYRWYNDGQRTYRRNAPQNTMLNRNGNINHLSGRKDNFAIKGWRALGSVRKKYLNKNTAKKAAVLAAKGVVGGIAAGTLGTMGIAAGLASDDFSNVWKYGSMGVLGGAAIGNAVVNQGTGVIKGAVNVGGTLKQGWRGSDKEGLNKELDKKALSSEKTRTALIQHFGVNWKEAKQKYAQLRKLGVTDVEEASKIIHIQDDYDDLTLEQAKAIKDVSDTVSKETLIKEPDKARKMIKNLTGGDDRQVEDIAKGMMFVYDNNKPRRTRTNAENAEEASRHGGAQPSGGNNGNQGGSQDGSRNNNGQGTNQDGEQENQNPNGRMHFWTGPNN